MLKKLNKNIDKATKQLDKEADKVGIQADAAVANQTGVKVSHITNPDASDHKEQVDHTRKILWLRDDNVETLGNDGVSEG